ncbi:hypothetical protein AKJ58_01260 [candidate division MSBL1 archaeon SCGC-AAA385D11]|uniref:Uncharacterized protein n=1 Tax=candidate division MSBL1 archaeon SCGC-AAA385D11 TaxID=1698286 RepID=A0A133VNF9_9EURY|nr:hypothetical protein AKJ58_01260 [candidate division MSBL1 archaeon SCGC-AAA385D11]
MNYEDLDVDMSTVYGWVWKLAFRELTKEGRLELAHDLIKCSLFDQEHRYKVLESLEEAIG